jgi:sugar phosphate isomerase/epimerase
VILGLQLHSLRRECAADPAAILRKVRGLGFDHVELAGTYGWTAAAWRALLDETGLRVIGLHLSHADFVERLPEWIEFSQAIGNARYVLGSLPEAERTADGYRRAAALLERAAATLQPLGGRVYYHHHAFEFADLGGATGLEILLRETDPNQVALEVDTHWVEKGGWDSYQFIAAHASRVGMIHARDIARADGSDRPPGQGDVNFPSILSLAKASAWPVIAEFGGTVAEPLEAARASAAYLRGLVARMR